MKNKILLLTIICFGMFGLKSCTDEDNFRLQAPETVEALSITNGLQVEYILLEETFGNVAERFTWIAPDFDVQTSITYDLEYSIDGLFENPTTINTTTENNIALTVEQLWNLAQDNLGLEPNTDNDSGELYFRIKADLGEPQAENSPASISETQVLIVKLLESGVEPPLVDLFLVGSATAAGWNENNNNTPIVRDPENPNEYSFTGKFNGSPNQFKLLEEKGNWDSQWGLSNGVFISKAQNNNDDPDPFDISGGDGYYTLTVNTADGTHDFVPFDASASPTYSTVGIIGFGTTGTDDGWSQDIDLTQSSFDTHLWYINGITLFEGEVKFRENNDWATNWGSNTALTGYGEFNGPNIPVSEGTYDVWFNDLDGSYVFIPQGE